MRHPSGYAMTTASVTSSENVTSSSRDVPAEIAIPSSYPSTVMLRAWLTVISTSSPVASPRTSFPLVSSYFTDSKNESEKPPVLAGTLFPSASVTSVQVMPPSVLNSHTESSFTLICGGTVAGSVLPVASIFMKVLPPSTE